MAKQNYRQAKRHKELARKARQEQKLLRRSTRVQTGSEAGTQDPNAAPQELGQPSSVPDRS